MPKRAPRPTYSPEPSAAESVNGVEPHVIDLFYDTMLPAVIDEGCNWGWSRQRIRRWKAVPRDKWREQIPLTRPGEEVLKVRFPGDLTLWKGDSFEVWMIDAREGTAALEATQEVRQIRSDEDGSWTVYASDRKVFDEIRRIARAPNGRLAIAHDSWGGWDLATRILGDTRALAAVKPPRTPSPGDWRRLKEKLGWTFPKDLRPFFDRARRHEFWETPIFREFETLRHTYAGCPLRLLHLADEGGKCGDSLGLYVPRDGARPFLAAHGHEETLTWPVTANLKGFAQDPDAFPGWQDQRMKGSKSLKARRARLRSQGGKPWEDLFANPKGACPERELLKDLVFQRPHYAEDPDRFFPPFLRRFGAADAVAVCVRQHLTNSRNCIRVATWTDLGKALDLQSEPRLALQAYQNAITMHFTDAWDDRGPAMWKSIDRILDRMEPLAKRGGDAFDRAMIPVHRAFTRR